MKYLLIIFFLIVAHSSNAKDSRQPIGVDTLSKDSSIYLADPTIFFHQGIYYLYGTVERKTGDGFLVYLSKDLHSWSLSTKNDGYALRKGDSFGDAGFWAPQVFSHNGKFYMAYTANEHIAIAEGDSPLGPFKQPVLKALDAPVKQIDPYVFIDEDGKIYLFHVRLGEGNKIFVAEMDDDLASIKPSTLRLCIEGDTGWENTAYSPWPVTEGPTVIRHKGLYYLLYSANDFRNPNYAVGYATSTSPLGPWVKFRGNPIMDKETIGENGTGHGDVFTDSLQQMWYVFHTHFSIDRATPRRTAMVRISFERRKKKDEDRVVVDAGSFYYLNR
ncbi:MAG TPA: glycoside hydrolase family 43 protein [Chitinophagaceae bacterium]|nr:glycoside hydrolase family 43 protein [Chitinophagaceae bacterium]